MFSQNLFSLNFTEFVITVIGPEPAASCVREQDATTVPAKHVRDRIFKFTLIHTSVIYQIPWICWIQWISVQFKLQKTPLKVQSNFRDM